MHTAVLFRAFKGSYTRTTVQAHWQTRTILPSTSYLLSCKRVRNINEVHIVGPNHYNMLTSVHNRLGCGLQSYSYPE